MLNNYERKCVLQGLQTPDRKIDAQFYKWKISKQDKNSKIVGKKTEKEMRNNAD